MINYTASATNFAIYYFAEKKMPVNTSITGGAANWGNSSAYDPITGVVNMTNCCG
jgi:hypothetical protein